MVRRYSLAIAHSTAEVTQDNKEKCLTLSFLKTAMWPIWYRLLLNWPMAKLRLTHTMVKCFLRLIQGPEQLLHPLVINLLILFGM